MTAFYSGYLQFRSVGREKRTFWQRSVKKHKMWRILAVHAHPNPAPKPSFSTSDPFFSGRFDGQSGQGATVQRRGL
jgi:hypothetical protein